MQDSVSNKQFFAVMMLLGLIIVIITILASSSCEDKKLTDSGGNELTMQSAMHTLDTSQLQNLIFLILIDYTSIWMNRDLMN